MEFYDQEREQEYTCYVKVLLSLSHTHTLPPPTSRIVQQIIHLPEYRLVFSFLMYMCVCVCVCACMYVCTQAMLVLVCIKCQQLENLDDTILQSSISISLMSKVVIGADQQQGYIQLYKTF